MPATLVQDLTFAIRLLRRQRAPALVAALCVAVGVGATTTLYSVADTLLLRPLPYPAGDRLVVVAAARAGDHAAGTSSYLDYLDWRARQHAFSSLAGVGGSDFTVRRPGADAERVPGALASSNLFATLGVEPEVGRVFTPEEDGAGGPPVAVVSDGFAVREFASAAGALAGSILVNGQAHTIIGVLPDRWRYPSRTEVWVPLGRDPLDGRHDRGRRNLIVMGALRPGASLASARRELQALVAELARTYPATNQGTSALVVPFRERMVGDATRSLAALALAAALVLLVACANVATLQLARAGARVREIAVRQALGADRQRLVRQVLTENVLLALVGGVAGVWLAYTSVGFVAHAIVNATPAWMTFAVDRRALAFSLFAALLTGIAFGLAPALRLAGVRATLAVRGGGGGAASSRAQRVLAAGEVALAVVLTAGALVAVESVRAIQRIPLGFDPEGVLTARLTMQGGAYDDVAARARLVDALESRLESLPGVSAAGAVSLRPVDGCCAQSRVRVEGDESEERDLPMITGTIATPGYFRAMGLPLLAGRAFTPGDRAGSPSVVVISETFARRWWPRGGAVGHFVDAGSGRAEIVGIVRDVKQTSLLDVPEPQFYRPYAQDPWTAVTLAARVRTGDPAALAPALRRALHELAPEIPVYTVETMDAVVARARASSQVFAELLVAFAAISLLLAAMGVYATMSFFVAQRTHELGLRLALGAEPTGLVRLVVRQSAAIGLSGVAAGLIGAAVASRVLAHILYGLEPAQPAAPLLAGAALLAVGVAATVGPARRASGADPMVALRVD